ncbi:MAG: flagellar biosynthesis protein FliQ [Planctomycetota bacterium]|jgi:flagellar biosynthetic protein FliQ
MAAQDAIDLVRNAIVMSLVLGAPVLLIGMLVGLFIGLIQALTQIQDQTVSTVPKLLAMTIAIMVALPWMADQLLDYSRNLIREIPANVMPK